MSPYKRGKYYYLDMELSDGRRLVRSTRQTSKRQARAIEATIRELDEKRGYHEELDAILDGRLKPHQVHAAKMAGRLDQLMDEIEDPPLDEALDRFVRQSPYRGTKWTADRLRRAAPDDARLSWLDDPDNLREFLAWHRRQGYSAGTEHRSMAWMSKMVRRAFGEERRQELWGALDLRDVDNKRCAWLTPQEMSALREIASARMWSLISTAAATGLRLGELLDLTMMDVDLEEGAVFVRQGKSESSRRRVPLVGEPLDTLRGWCDGLGEREKLWPDMTNNKIWHRFDRYRRHLKLKTQEGEWFRFHDLRHHYAVYMARQGVPLTELRDLLGHSTLRMTERYALYTPPPATDRFEQAYRSMGLGGAISRESRHSDQHTPREDRSDAV